jgi:hypothetical protein
MALNAVDEGRQVGRPDGFELSGGERREEIFIKEPRTLGVGGIAATGILEAIVGI